MKNILLDFGGVLYKIDHLKTIKEFKLLSSSPSIFNEKGSEIIGKQILTKYESGLISSDEFRTSIKNYFFITADHSQFDNAWNATLVSLYPDSFDIIKELSQKAKLFLLSNTSEIHYKKFEPECRDMFSMFDHCFFSFLLGDVKPNKSIFKKVCELACIHPEETLFIDDTEVNIIAARELGFASVLLKDRNELYNILSQY